jgi:hypothetical protein
VDIGGDFRPWRPDKGPIAILCSKQLARAGRFRRATARDRRTPIARAGAAHRLIVLGSNLISFSVCPNHQSDEQTVVLPFFLFVSPHTYARQKLVRCFGTEI